MRPIKVASCNLNQWALDFSGNKDRITRAARKAIGSGAALLVTPELSICGYSCLDAFLELDTVTHSWEVLEELLQQEELSSIILDVGMPIIHRSCLYNCRVIIYGKEILYIRPKMSLANDGLFREMRYFTPWQRRKVTEDFLLPHSLNKLIGQKVVPFGDCILRTNDVVIGVEMCEELFTPDNPSIHQSFNGVDVITNASASHWQLRKLSRRLELIRESSKKGGSCYLYSNQQGCDGSGREYYDGCALIALNGEIVAQGSQFSLNDVEVIEATVDLDKIWNARFPPSRRMQASAESPYPSVHLDVAFVQDASDPGSFTVTSTKEPVVVSPEEEIGLAAGCWYWDYLRRSNQAGVFIPLSGGIDSCTAAVLFFSTCRLVFAAVEEGNGQVLEDMLRICGLKSDDTWRPASPQDLCDRMLHTCYMGTENSSKETRSRARDLAQNIGSFHVDMNIDSIVKGFVTVWTTLFSRKLRFRSQGGSNQEGLALQNIQSRSRMVLAYFLASTLTLVRNRPGGGTLLVLGSANVDECLRGYLTKYDCSSADINAIGSISKKDLSNYLRFAMSEYDLPILACFLEATPTAELEPITNEYVQSDEVDMGCTYEELGIFGRLRKIEKLGPYSMWQRLCTEWTHLTPREVYSRVRFLWYYFGINRHKQEILTPALHAETYSPDSNRYDLLPFLRPSLTWAYNKIERALGQIEAK